MARSKTSVANPIDAHPIILALSKARAMAAVLGHLADPPLTSHIPLEDCPEGTRDWLTDVVATALREAIDEADAEFRKSVTPEHQVISPN